MKSRIGNVISPQRKGLPPVFKADGSISKAYAWGVIKQPSLKVRNRWRFKPSAKRGRFFPKRTALSAVTRWCPIGTEDMVVDQVNGWAPWEDISAVFAWMVKPGKRSTDLTHPTRIWRCVASGMGVSEKSRREGLWLKDDLYSLGYKPEDLDKDYCIDDDNMMEATPIGFRAAGAHSFQIASMRQSVCVVDKKRFGIFFIKQPEETEALQ